MLESFFRLQNFTAFVIDEDEQIYSTSCRLTVELFECNTNGAEQALPTRNGNKA